MGLDCYAYTKDEDNSTNEIWYGRKIRWVHNFMAEIYYSDESNTDDFNVVEIEVDKEDLERLQKLLDSGELFTQYSQKGFFFGDWEADEYIKNSIQKLIDEGNNAISSGKTLFYSSWY